MVCLAGWFFKHVNSHIIYGLSVWGTQGWAVSCCLLCSQMRLQCVWLSRCSNIHHMACAWTDSERYWQWPRRGKTEREHLMLLHLDRLAPRCEFCGCQISPAIFPPVGYQRCHILFHMFLFNPVWRQFVAYALYHSCSWTQLFPLFRASQHNLFYDNQRDFFSCYSTMLL